MSASLWIVKVFSSCEATVLITKGITIVSIERVEEVVDQQTNFHFFGKVLLDFIVANEIGKGEWVKASGYVGSIV
jgi:hypothetical protein